MVGRWDHYYYTPCLREKRKKMISLILRDLVVRSFLELEDPDEEEDPPFDPGKEDGSHGA